MSHYKPYHAYKDSGVEWLGQVPEHWAVCKLSFRYSIELGKMLDEKKLTKTNLVSYLRNQDVQWGSINTQDLPEMDIHSGELERYTIRNGDLLVCEGGDVGRAAIWRGENSVFGYQKALHRLRHRSVGADTAEFFYFSLLTAKQRGVFEESDSKATIAHLPAEKFRQYRFAFPPLAEQQTIASHLDRETARIDALVEKKTRFIELLREKRQALITHAVTKGLDPDVKMKGSGVEWLGEVPEHWETKRVAAMFREVIRPGQTDLPVLSISIHSGISDDELSAEERDRKVSLIEDREKYKRVCPGDLAYNMMRAWQGGFGAVAVDGLVSPAYVVAEPRTEFCTEYVELLLRTPMAIEEMRRFSRGIADFRMRLYWEAFRDVVLLFPPVDEQQAIIKTIKREGMRIDALVSKTECSISLLKERRSALITAAVTGQIDLREAV
ncbi:restriction endonuclease subunit S [Pseudomonas monteilii]|uniref:restriction endonuclease subunit S n=1 Tax=Pseudomonas TaxID=286 RepID=UPI001559F686|nr:MULTISPECIES: restriction endonuclease subunit S [unclassified Pseudomonas]ELS0923779.1 restriction endonuclease subunit S [Pseudomonas putida]MBI6922577.1 restriction endonuclease subunit S [Pseudomonas monteilii]MCE0939119.1 restriction endonuclease subunit S [Pseudomonas kurunegalensis]